MYLHHIPSSYGRLVPKPVKVNRNEELYVDNMTIQDQIENLRIKISLKERYNTCEREEAEESHEGTSSVIHDLNIETRKLRVKFMAAVQAERLAVQNALRTHRTFQLALKNTVPGNAIPWLDDKLFDMAKKLNCLLFGLYHKRKKLEEVERAVELMERCPRPGSQPWELESFEVFHRLEYDIENMKVQLETANILHSKYHEIKYILREERGKYVPVLKTLENTLENQRKELAQLQKMLADAIVFENDSAKKLVITEQEASKNRKTRRRRMARIKKAVQKILESNQLAASRGGEAARHSHNYAHLVEKLGTSTDDTDAIRQRQQEVERFQEKTRKLVEVMKVPDLTYIPIRYRTIMELGRYFPKEQKAKLELRNLLLHQQNTLSMILCHFRHTGQRQQSEFSEKKRILEEQKTQIDKDVQEYQVKLQKNGEMMVEARQALLTILDRFGSIPPKKKKHLLAAPFAKQLKLIQTQVIKLVEAVARLQEEVPESDDEYSDLKLQHYVKPRDIPNRLIRVGIPTKTEDSDGEDDYTDMKVPGRVEIKALSLRFLTHAKLKKGIQ